MNTVNTKQGALFGFWIALIASILLSTKAIFVKIAFRDYAIDPSALLALRMILALPFYLATVIYIARRKGRVPFTPRQWIQVTVLGLLGYYLSSLFDFIGLQYVSAGLERLILFLYPTFAVLINAFYFRQRITTFQRWALLLTYAGMVISYVGEMHLSVGNPHFYMGTLFILGCSVTYAIYLVGNGRLAAQVGATPFTAYAMLAATAGVLIHYAFNAVAHPLHLTPHLLGLGVLLAIIATVLPTFLFTAAIQKIGSSSVAIISSVGPVSTILQAHWILSEPIFTAQIIGTIMITGGVVMMKNKSVEK